MAKPTTHPDPDIEDSTTSDLHHPTFIIPETSTPAHDNKQPPNHSHPLWFMVT